MWNAVDKPKIWGEEIWGKKSYPGINIPRCIFFKLIWDMKAFHFAAVFATFDLFELFIFEATVVGCVAACVFLKHSRVCTKESSL